ncbi:MAG: PAS domain-containing protein, partial [Deltaproteobacteria bacterium]|nr:PAS domain-containing protein [Deltaproteobacteria bacterium]
TWDTETGHVTWSDALFEVLGYEPSARIDFDKVNSEMHHPEDLERVTRWLNAAISSGERKLPPNEYRVVRKDGKILDVRTQGVIEREEGKSAKIFATIQDITERRRAEKELWDREERLNLALKGGDLGAWDWNIQTGKVRFNERWAQMKGYTLDEIKPRLSTWEKMVHTDDLPRVYDILNAHLEGKIPFYEAEFRMRHKSGEWLWIQDKGKVIERDGHGKPLRACGTHLDITERKQAEQELKRYQKELEKRVESRTAELQAANKELEAFAYSVSHDLRAPLRAITGFAEIIARRHRESLNEEGRHYFDNIVEAGNRMGVLIGDLLTFSRLGKDALAPEAIELSPLIKNILSDFEARRIKVGAEIVVEDDLPVIKAVQTLLVQTLTNLVDNALKYRRSDVLPRIEISGATEGRWTVIRVKDNGLGIAAEHQEKIFNIFQRLYSREVYSGTGVGLAIVKKAAMLMGGTVGLESEAGKGSLFWVRLPQGVL